MALFEKFPWINFHDLNLNWILKKLGDHEDRVTTLETEMDTAESDIDALQDLDVTSGLLYSAASKTASLPVQQDISAGASTVSINKKVYVTTVYKGNFTDETAHSSSMTIPAATSSTAGVMTAAQVETLEGMDSRVSTAEQDAEEAYKTASEMDDRIGAAENAISENAEDIDNLESRVSANETNIASNDTDIADLESRVSTNETDIDSIQGTYWLSGETIYLVSSNQVIMPLQFGLGQTPTGVYLYVKQRVDKVTNGTFESNTVYYKKYQIPIVTSAYDGVMSSEMYKLLKDLESRVKTLEGDDSEETANTDVDADTSEIEDGTDAGTGEEDMTDEEADD